MYGSIVLADAFFEDYDFEGTWNGTGGYTDVQKEKALEKATMQIDRLKFLGEKYDYDQNNQYPRAYNDGQRTRYFDIDTDGNIETPENILHATYIQAKWLLDTKDNATIQALMFGITSISVCKTSQTIDSSLMPFNPKTGICSEAYELIKPYMMWSY